MLDFLAVWQYKQMEHLWNLLFITHVPFFSTARERTAPWWHSIFTRASFWFGDQRVTVPLGWPRWIMAFWGFWHITSSRPVLVLMATTSFPTDTSKYCKKLVELCWQHRDQVTAREINLGCFYTFTTFLLHKYKNLITLQRLFKFFYIEQYLLYQMYMCVTAIF